MTTSIIFGIMAVVAVPLLVAAFIHDEKKREAEVQEYLEFAVEEAKKRQKAVSEVESPIAKQYNISGEVELSFIVEKDGSLSHINVIQDIGADCGVEAVEMVKGMPKWKPAIHNGVPVRCIQKLSVCFEN